MKRTLCWIDTILEEKKFDRCVPVGRRGDMTDWLLKSVVECNGVQLLKSSTEAQIWGACKLLEYFHFVKHDACTPLQLGGKYCILNLFSTTYQTALMTCYFTDYRFSSSSCLVKTMYFQMWSFWICVINMCVPLWVEKILLHLELNKFFIPEVNCKMHCHKVENRAVFWTHETLTF